MKRSSRLVALVGLCLLALGTTTADEQPSATPILPLWEPDWSPHTLGPNQLTHYPDSSVDACIADTDADGLPEIVTLGFDSLRTLDLVDGVIHERRVQLGDPYGWGGEPVRGRCFAAGYIDPDPFPDFVIATADWELLVFRQWPNPVRSQGDALPIADLRCDLSQRIPVNEGVHRLWLIDHVGRIYTDLFVPDRFDLVNPLRVFEGNGVGEFEEQGVVEGVTGVVHTVQEGAYNKQDGVWIGSTHGVWFARRESLQAVQVLDYGGAASIVAEDFDLDGDTDIAVPGYSLHLFTNQGDGFVETRFPLDVPVAYWMEKGDLDGDGRWDLVLGDKDTAQFTAYIWRDGEFTHAGAYGVGYDEAARSMKRGMCADLNGDGRDDIILPLSIAQIAALTSAGGYRSPQLSPGNTLLGQGDVDGDGEREILVTDQRPGISRVEVSDSGLLRSYSLPLLDGDAEQLQAWSPFAVSVANINGDGLPDLVGLAGSSLDIWIGDGDAWLRYESLTVESLASPQVAVLDLDEDDQDEVVLARETDILIVDTQAGRGTGPTTSVVDWGGEVGPSAVLTVDGKRMLVGLCVSETTKLQALDSRGIADLGLELELAVLSCCPVDATHDGDDELAFVGFGIFGEGDDAHLGVQVGVLDIDRDAAHILGLWYVSNWMAWSIPFSYSGLVALPGGNRAPTLCVSHANGVTGRTYIDVIRPLWETTEAISERLTAKSGVSLAPITQGDVMKEWVISIPEIEPRLLQVVEVRR